MKDKHNEEIKVGSLVKRCGNVRYADGLRYKVSKKTWEISKVEGGQLFYKDENGNDVLLSIPKNDGAFLVVGDKKGFKPEYAPVKELKIEAGSVAEKYRVLKAVKGWKKGDVVSITGKVAFETLEKGILEKVSPDTPHQHVLIVADPIRVFGKTNK